MEDTAADFSERPLDSDSKENIPPLAPATTTSTLKMTAKYATFDCHSEVPSSKIKITKSASNPASTSDSFMYETKYVVLGFMKNFPKDIDSRTWTPASSTPSSETSGKLSSASDHKVKRTVLPKRGKRKSAQSFESQVSSEEQRPDSLNINYNLKPHSGWRDKWVGQGGVTIPPTQKDESESSKGDRDSVKDLLFVPRISNAASKTNGVKSELENPPDFSRSISVGSSRDGSNTADADDELDSNSTHSSQKLDPSASGTYSHTDFTDDVEVDTPSGNSSNDSVEIDEYFEDSYVDDNGVDSAASRMKKLSSTNTIIPELSDGGELPESVGDEDPFKDADVVPKVLSKGDLHLDLDCCNTFSRESNITESLQEVIEESSSHLESEVNDAVTQGILTPMQHDIVSSLASPETEVARALVAIADRVEQQYGLQLETAVQNAFHMDLSDIPYEEFRRAFTGVLGDTLTGWTEVALCLVYSRRLTFALVQSGQRRVNYLFDYASRLLADKAADFIINQGGWSSLAQANIDTTPPSYSHGSGDSSRVGSPTKGQGLQLNGKVEEPSVVSPVHRDAEADDSSSEETTSSTQEPSSLDHSRVLSAMSISALIGRAHPLGLHFSVAAALVVIGIAVVLSKH